MEAAEPFRRGRTVTMTSPLWRTWGGHLAERLRQGDPIETGLLSLVPMIREAVVGEGGKVPRWDLAGIEVCRGPLGTSGASVMPTDVRDAPKILLSNRSDENVARRRFTAAHEVAHILIAAASVEMRSPVPQLTWEQEEHICNTFAARLLAFERVPKLLTVGVQQKFDLASFWSVVDELDMNLQPAILTMKPELQHLKILLILAEVRGHPKRPKELEPRIVTSAGDNRFYLPRYQRLKTMGLDEVATWISRASIGASTYGVASCPRFAVRGLNLAANKSMTRGSATWETQKVAQRKAIVVVQTRDLTIEWVPQRRRRTLATDESGQDPLFHPP